MCLFVCPSSMAGSQAFNLPSSWRGTGLLALSALQAAELLSSLGALRYPHRQPRIRIIDYVRYANALACGFNCKFERSLLIKVIHMCCRGFQGPCHRNPVFPGVPLPTPTPTRAAHVGGNGGSWIVGCVRGCLMRDDETPHVNYIHVQSKTVSRCAADLTGVVGIRNLLRIMEVVLLQRFLCGQREMQICERCFSIFQIVWSHPPQSQAIICRTAMPRIS
ncbi:hypothetical protein GGR57DRAFT_484612 [Xylariaceae sp. FL1272]|nr:hypothetical protein GGR57DRAFT_484612 [Xylariaceae sp. FL1272]